MLGALSRHFLVVGALLSLVVAASSASATPFTHCDSIAPVLSAQGTTVTCELTESGDAAATITVPAGTIRIDVTVRGGGGGAGGEGTNGDRPGYSGGVGAQIVASLLPSSSTELTIKVGSSGQPKGPLQGGTGGGFSAIYEGANASAGSEIVIAGGGGGGGYGTRCTDGGVGGSGGQGPAGAGSTGLGGNAPGIGGGGFHGAYGLGGAIHSPLSGTPGANGFSWSAGGAGGAGGTTRGGNGGDGYGGGGEGGVVAAATAVTCPLGSTGVEVAPNDGSGGGGGGSYVLPGRLTGTALYSSAGGPGGQWVDGVLDPAQNGTVTLTFVGTTYTVTYDGNGAMGGTVPTDYWGLYFESTIVTVCDDHRTDLNCNFPNAERMTRDGYTFEGWNTARDGSGRPHAPTNTFAITANTVLYAQWKALPSPTTPTLPTTKPKTTATGVTVTFTAPGPGTATTSATVSQATRANVTVCRGTTKVRKAGKAVVTCKLNATGRRLRAKGTLTVVLTTTFVAKTSTRLQATHTVVLRRRG